MHPGAMRSNRERSSAVTVVVDVVSVFQVILDLVRHFHKQLHTFFIDLYRFASHIRCACVVHIHT